jgi:dienelactone hydrolase
MRTIISGIWIEFRMVTFNTWFFCVATLAMILSSPWTLGQSISTSGPLVGTEPLTMQGDIASELIAGVDRFLIRQIEVSAGHREADWLAHGEPSQATDDWLGQKRALLVNQLGMVDPRIGDGAFQIQTRLNSMGQSNPVIASSKFADAHRVSWPVHPGVDGTGVIVVPSKGSAVRFACVLVPDAGQLPEQLCGCGPNASNIAFRIADQGGMVVVPQVLSRNREARNGRAVMTDQEFIYRSAFALGRHVLGYQVNETLAAIDIFKKNSPDLPVFVVGWGEGGWIALNAAAVDTRVDVACVSGHFGPREDVWKEPLHRNVQSLLSHFGDAQLAALVAPRQLVVDAIAGPSFETAGEGGAPGKLSGPTRDDAKREFSIATRLVANRKLADRLHFVEARLDTRHPSEPSAVAIARSMDLLKIKMLDRELEVQVTDAADELLQSTKQRQLDLVRKWDRFQQRILESIAMERQPFWDKLKGINASQYSDAIEPARERFRQETIGDWERELAPFRPRTRLVYDKPRWTGYEVLLDVFDEVFACGILLVPKDGKPVAHRPCVVFQHGLEGRPTDTIEGDHPAYHDVSAKLAEQGYVVFAPQNLYLFKDRFRTLQRKSNPLGRTLFSIMVPQHQQIVRWLSTRPEVDAKRIGFYGLSYGGKSAMRIPALVPEYCLSICSADFNDWVWKNASTTSPYSYVWTNEYEIFEFGLGRTFNYAEMAALIAPRPFMVERGHFDGVAPDERVALEFAKVNRLYSTILKSPNDCEIEWFDGPHTINGKGTFRFLASHLDWTPGAK